MKPGISERTFEFCYNAEFCQRHRALLASHPYLPSQNAEKDLGYDVEFEIRTRRFTRSIFLQHKVAHFAEHRSAGTVASRTHMAAHTTGSRSPRNSTTGSPNWLAAKAMPTTVPPAFTPATS